MKKEENLVFHPLLLRGAKRTLVYMSAAARRKVEKRGG